MRCFSYGSNMSLARLRARVPSAQFCAVATLSAHRLCFHKIGKDRSGKCDAEHTGNPDDRVIGVVYEISADEKSALDGHEGLGAGYDEKEVIVTTAHGEALSAMMYFATTVDASLRPYNWYREHVLAGARENALPAEYVARIEAVEAIVDPDRERCERELAIHC